MWKGAGCVMSDYLDGQAAARFVLSQVMQESGAYREGYGSAIKASGIGDINALALMQNVKGDRDGDPDDYDFGFRAARETIRQVVAKSAEFRAGFASELRVVGVKAEFDAAVERRADVLYRDHKAIQAIADRLAAGRRLDDRGIGLTARHRFDIEVELRAIEKVRAVKDFEERVQKKLFEHRIAIGTAEFVDSNGTVFKLGEGPTLAQRKMQRTAYFAGNQIQALQLPRVKIFRVDTRPPTGVPPTAPQADWERCLSSHVDGPT